MEKIIQFSVPMGRDLLNLLYLFYLFPPEKFLYDPPAVEMYKAYIQLRHLLIARHFKQFFGAHVLVVFIKGQGKFEQQ